MVFVMRPLHQVVLSDLGEVKILLVRLIRPAQAVVTILAAVLHFLHY